MAWVVKNPEQYLDQPAVKEDSSSTTWCVALPKKKGMGVPDTGRWIRGDQVRGKVLTLGTVIATFGDDGLYKNIPKESHVALYDGQDQHGIKVIEQYPNCGKIKFKRYQFGDRRGGEKDGNNYYVVEDRNGPVGQSNRQKLGRSK